VQKIVIEIVFEIGRRGSTVQKIVIEKLIFISRGHVLRDWQWCKIDGTGMFCLADKNDDVDDDDEYTNAAAAHAAFVMTVSSLSDHVLVITSCTARALHKYS